VARVSVKHLKPDDEGDMGETVKMPTLSAVQVRVNDTEQAVSFFGSVFAWEFRQVQGATGSEAGVLPPGATEMGTVPPVQLVFTDDQDEPSVRLGFTAADLGAAVERVQSLGGQVDLDKRGCGQADVRGSDDQGTPLLLRAAGGEVVSGGSPEGRGVLGVIFVFAQVLERAADFYHGLAGWDFEAIGGNKDILFVKSGPALGIRPASRAPSGKSGAVTFHISVPDLAAITEAIQAHDGQVGPPQSAGLFTTRACRDNQGTPFSLWYQPTAEPHT
jgi:predicted enzyme related to lactoylglutathione lyase